MCGYDPKQNVKSFENWTMGQTATQGPDWSLMLTCRTRFSNTAKGFENSTDVGTRGQKVGWNVWPESSLDQLYVYNSTLYIYIILWRNEVKSLSCVRLFVTPWTVAYQAPPSMGFSRQEYWSGVPFPSPRNPPDPGIWATREAYIYIYICFVYQHSPW